jgi:hypothetical protein
MEISTTALKLKEPFLSKDGFVMMVEGNDETLMESYSSKPSYIELDDKMVIV